MNERLRILRETLNLSQEALGDKINVTRSHVSSLEKGKRSITDRIITDICREFNVNEEWIRNGIGEMFVKTSNELLDQLAAKYNLKSAEKQAFQALLELSEEDRDKIGDLIRNIFSGFFTVSSDDTISATKEIDTNSIDYEVQAYRAELVAEQKGEIYSVSEDTEKDSENQNLA